VKEDAIISAAQRIAAERIGISGPKQKQAVPRGEFENSLRRTLQDADMGLEFSSHAIDRLQKRNLTVSAEQLSRLNNAVNKASDKGAKESLIMVDNLAMIVSITNRKVITAMDVAGMKENVITNIDSAVIS